jgi:sensor histidine kinase YesM
MKDNYTTTALASAEDYTQSKKFWLNSFAVYIIAEAVYIIINYIITKSMCTGCALPPAFYISQWAAHIIFTGLLWYCLNFFYHKPLWKIIIANIVIFFIYYFLWLGALYSILNSGQGWLVGAVVKIKSLRELIYWSWSDIGKYVLKLSAFYMLKFYFEYKKADRQRIQLALINKDMQLNLLKTQLSPHFYFNTLNNLYGLARSNSVKLVEALHQLYNIMQYVIVDCNRTKVLLSQEINFLNSYIALEKLRYEKDTVIEMSVAGIAGTQTILPLLLIQFVENAFKHGMKEKLEQNWMKVNLLIDKNELLFKVENSYYGKAISEGIGINSVKNILGLQYEGRHDIKLKHEENYFSVTLKLNLL